MAASRLLAENTLIHDSRNPTEIIEIRSGLITSRWGEWDISAHYHPSSTWIAKSQTMSIATTSIQDAAEITIAYLRSYPEMLPELATWFKSEWPAWYGPGGQGIAELDLAECCNEAKLPLGVIALRKGLLCGIAILKSQSIASHSHLTPWAAAGLVKPSLRGHGIGRLLLTALESEAQRLGYPTIYCATSTSVSLLQRAGWQFFESAQNEGETLAVYMKTL